MMDKERIHQKATVCHFALKSKALSSYTICRFLFLVKSGFSLLDGHYHEMLDKSSQCDMKYARKSGGNASTVAIIFSFKELIVRSCLLKKFSSFYVAMYLGNSLLAWMYLYVYPAV